MNPPVINSQGAPKAATYLLETTDSRLPNAVTRIIKVVTAAVTATSTTLTNV